MTASTTAQLPVRVMVTDAWQTVDLLLPPHSPVRVLKEEALRRALHAMPPSDAYQVKYRGALVLDEERTLAEVGVPPDAHLIVLPARRRPVR